MSTDAILIHSYKIPVKGVKKKIIYHFSDVHLTAHDSESSEDEVRRSLEGTAEWEKLRVSFAKDNGEPCDAAQLVSTREHLKNLISAANGGDALVMAGDVCDFISGANLRALDAELGTLRVPFVSVCGNHEKADEIPDGMLCSAMAEPVQTLDLGDLVIFAVDNSRKQITEHQLSCLKAVLAEAKSVIIVMHIPLRTEGNAAQFEECGEYFQLNDSKATPEVYEFIDIIKENADKIIAVLAGHLHFISNSEIAPGVTQYVSTQGALGNVNRYEIGE